MKKKYSEEQIAVVNQTNLAEYLRYCGEALEKSGREWRWMRYDSLTVRGNQWFRHSEQKGGYPIEFLRKFYGLSFTQVMQELLTYHGNNSKAVIKSEVKQKAFRAPPRFSNSNRIIEYLMRERYIGEAVLNVFIERKFVYEDRDYHNIVFAGYDEKGTIRHAHKKSIRSDFRGNVEGSEPEYSFYFQGSNQRLLVFEAPIDLLSYISLHQEAWKENHYLALNGLSKSAIQHRLMMNQEINEITLCLDHDNAGLLSASRMEEVLEDQGYAVNAHLPKHKDWNDDLKAAKGIPVPGLKENERMLDGKNFIKQLSQTLQAKQKSDADIRDLMTAFSHVLGYERIEESALLDDLDVMMRTSTALRHQTSAQPYQLKYQMHKDTGSLKERIKRLYSQIDDLKTALYSANEKANPAGNYAKILDECSHIKFYLVQKRKEEQRMEEKRNKPKAALIGADGNIYNLMGIASKALRCSNQAEAALEMVERITNTAKNYDEALRIITEYVEVISVEETMEHQWE